MAARKTAESSFWVWWVFCLVVFVSAEQKNLTAESGQSVTLPCRAPRENIPVTVAEWSRADLDPEEYVLLYRDEQLNPEHQHPSFKERADLQDRRMRGGNMGLSLKDVTTADTGTYECRVIQKTRTERRRRAWLMADPVSVIDLHVVPPGQPGGHRKDGGKEDGSVGLKVGLSVCAVVVGGVGFLIYRKCKSSRIRTVGQRWSSSQSEATLV